jgi:hypothetical protein
MARNRPGLWRNLLASTLLGTPEKRAYFDFRPGATLSSSTNKPRRSIKAKRAVFQGSHGFLDDGGGSVNSPTLGAPADCSRVIAFTTSP